MDHALDVLAALGAVVVERANVKNESKYASSELLTLLYEFNAGLNSYLKEHPDAPRRSMKEIFDFNRENIASVMPFFEQERMKQAVRKGALTDRLYLKALEKKQRLSRGAIDGALVRQNLDAIVAPTGGPAWMIDLVNGDNYRGGGFSTLAAVPGYPQLTVPAGYLIGRPGGLSFFGTAWSEGQLLRYGYAFEQATHVRKAPQFLPTANLSAAEFSW